MPKISSSDMIKLHRKGLETQKAKAKLDEELAEYQLALAEKYGGLVNAQTGEYTVEPDKPAQ